MVDHGHELVLLALDPHPLTEVRRNHDECLRSVRRLGHGGYRYHHRHRRSVLHQHFGFQTVHRSLGAHGVDERPEAFGCSDELITGAPDQFVLGQTGKLADGLVDTVDRAVRSDHDQAFPHGTEHAVHGVAGHRGLPQSTGHLVECGRQLPDLVGGAHAEGRYGFSPGEGARRPDHLLQGTGHRLGQQGRRQHREHREYCTHHRGTAGQHCLVTGEARQRVAETNPAKRTPAEPYRPRHGHHIAGKLYKQRVRGDRVPALRFTDRGVLRRVFQRPIGIHTAILVKCHRLEHILLVENLREQPAQLAHLE